MTWPDPGHTGAECRICPLCQAISALRQVRPETVEQLATAVTELVATVRELVSGLIPDAGADRGQDAAPPGAAGSAAGARTDPVLQRIEITD